ncbi:hypothetical protein ACPA9J_28155 [Pseudomonas aeruginosa]
MVAALVLLGLKWWRPSKITRAPETRRELDEKKHPRRSEPPGAGALPPWRRLRPYLQRRPEGYRPDHAGTDRHRPGRVRPRPEQHHLPDRAHPRRRPAPQSVLPAPHRYLGDMLALGKSAMRSEMPQFYRCDPKQTEPTINALLRRPARRAQLQRPGRRRARAGASLPAVPGRHRVKKVGKLSDLPAREKAGPREATQGPDRDHRIRAVPGHHRGGPGSRHRHHGRLEARSAHLSARRSASRA